jgi:hypothetical protein
MSRWIALLVAVVVCVGFLPSALAQKSGVQQQIAVPQTKTPQQAVPRPVKLETVEISVGQKIADADAALRHHGKQASIGQAFQTSGGPQDSQDLSFYLDEKRTFVAVHFHKTTQQVYGITACVMPEGNPGRLHHTYFSVRQITLHPDGSYSIQFEKPVPPKPAAERPQNVYPKSEFPTNPGNGQVPPNNVRGDARY